MSRECVVPALVQVLSARVRSVRSFVLAGLGPSLLEACRAFSSETLCSMPPHAIDGLFCRPTLHACLPHMNSDILNTELLPTGFPERRELQVAVLTTVTAMEKPPQNPNNMSLLHTDTHSLMLSKLSGAVTAHGARTLSRKDIRRCDSAHRCSCSDYIHSSSRLATPGQPSMRAEDQRAQA